MKRYIARMLAVLTIVVTPWSSAALEVPPLAARVNDTARLLSQATHVQLEEILAQLEQKTSAQVAILTVESLEGEDRDEYSLKVAESWGLGQDDKDNGILILYAGKEDRLKIEVGYGLEGAIPDGKAGEILRQQFRANAPKEGQKDLDRAFVEVVNAISTIVLTEYANDPTGESLKGPVLDGELLLFTLGVAFVVTGICGAINEPLGVIVGTIEGTVLGLYLTFGLLGVVVLAVIGAIIGLIAKYVLEGMLEGGGSGSYGGSYSSSSDSGGGFSGGGGDFGGGGAGD